MEPTRRPRSAWSWKIGSLAGIDLRVHTTFFLLLLWIALVYAPRGGTALALGFLLILTIFAIVVVHELGHALMARHFGYRTRDIMLLPIGGIASLERMPTRPAQELAVAVIGPAVNLAIAGLIALGILVAGGSFDVGDATSLGGAFAAQLVWINLVLAGFNLLPAFPMDGGRALRALLAMRLGQTRATDIAAMLGKVMAVLLGLVGLLTNPFLVVIAVVVWLGAGQEAALVHVKSALAGVPVRAAMVTRVDAVAPEQSLDDAAAVLVAAGRNEVTVVDHGRPVSVLTRKDIAEGIARGGGRRPVADAPHHDVVTVAPNDSLDALFDQLREMPGAVAVVVDHDRPVGLVTPDQLAAFAALHGA